MTIHSSFLTSKQKELKDYYWAYSDNSKTFKLEQYIQKLLNNSFLGII